MIADTTFPPLFWTLLTARRASLIQQAKALESQRSAILSEVGEIEKALNIKKGKTLDYHEGDSVSCAQS